MKILFAILMVASFLSACGQPTPANNDNKIVLGNIESINSGILHEKRKIWIYIPDSYKNNPSTSQRFPVVYLLDGDAHFYSVVGMIQQLSSVNGNSICPEMIVVGIPNTDRTRDLTPTHVAADPPFLDSNSSKNSGGGEQFTSFIEKELMPHIDSLYPTNSFKMLIGHSFGGLMVINTLMHHPKLFNAYVAIDPSMWWDDKKLLK
ncbi:MAG TPA: alpha/beta hydrolase-fold protein, partial [Chitinophagaceae bacterium]|nr:alpha/beta hydrolase-fold protein [Chitinophagaceae bacterium]